MTQLTILTGASRGMGLAMAEQLCTPNHTLLCISRGSADALEALAKKNGTNLLQWQADLSQPETVADQLKAWLQKQDGSTFSQARLINNAGVIGHLGPIEQASASSVQQALAINLAAPILLTQVFLQATRVSACQAPGIANFLWLRDDAPWRPVRCTAPPKPV
jgi:NAD(P)-dependent dehydrogenase (short-subunit alcohol dehydrogenase family)